LSAIIIRVFAKKNQPHKLADSVYSQASDLHYHYYFAAVENVLLQPQNPLHHLEGDSKAKQYFTRCVAISLE